MTSKLFNSSWMSRSVRLAAETYISGLQLLFFLGLLIPLYIAAIYFAGIFYGTISQVTMLALLAVVFLVFGLASLLRWEPGSSEWIRIFALLVVATILGRLWFAFSFQQEYYSDFRTMWDFACRVAESDIWIVPNRPQTERPLPVFTPLALLFGCSDSVFKVFNVLAVTLSSVLVALITKDLVGRSAAIVVFTIASVIPEGYFASLIPTHDVPGLLFLLLYLYILHLLLHKRQSVSRKHILVFALVMGLTGLMLHVQRGIFYPLWVATALYFPVFFYAYRERIGMRHAGALFFSCLLAPVLIVFLTTAVLQSKGILYDRDNPNSPYSVGGAYSLFHTMVDGSFSSGSAFVGRYSEGQSLETKRYYGKAFVYTDLYRDWGQRPSNFLARIQQVTRFSTQGEFYYGDLKGLTDDDRRKVIDVFDGVNFTFWHVFSIVLLFSLVCLVVKRDRSSIHIGVFLPTIFVGLSVFAIGLIGETQPRYLMFLPWLLILPAVAVAQAFVMPSSVVQVPLPEKQYPLWGWCALMALLVGGLGLGWLYLSRSDVLLVDMSEPRIECVGISQSGCVAARLFPTGSDISGSDVRSHSNVTLRHTEGLAVGNSVRAIYTLPPLSKTSRGLVSLYVQTPYLREDGLVGYFDNNVLIDGVIRETLNLSDSDDYHYVEIEVEGTGMPIELGLEVVSNVNNTRASWLRASLANFRFVAFRELE